jgi:hypothetical protein
MQRSASACDPVSWDRASKLLVTLWAVTALLIECSYVAPAWPALRWIGPAVMAVTALAAAFNVRAVAFVVAVPYVFPALVWLATGRHHVHYTTAWLAGVLGVMLPQALTSGWHVPRPWRAPLAAWAGVICVTAPIIIARSADFHWELLTRSRRPEEALGGLTFHMIGWIGHVALVTVLGILWFDWLCGKREDFVRRYVVTPLAASALVLAGVSVYQMFVNVAALNPTMFATLGRAAGTMFDANVAGMLAAMWIGGWVMLARRSHRMSTVAQVVPALLMWLAVWASGSRTALAAALLVSLFALAHPARRLLSSPRSTAAAVALALVVTSLLIFYAPRLTVVGPVARLRVILPPMTEAGLTAFAGSLFWTRDNWGAAAHRIIETFPLFGIGVGTFHDTASEFGAPAKPDNAQNWFRHQIAELGIVGSLGWIAFVALFAWWLFRSRRSDPPEAWITRGTLLAFALASLVGVPGQNPAVALTFWTIAAWCVLIMEPPGSAAPLPARTWAIAGLVVLVSAAGTAWYAVGRLRTPVRIQHAEAGLFTEYSYGFWRPEHDASGEFRWARKEATAVFAAKGYVLDVTASASDPDLGTRPKPVKVWVDGKTVIDTELTTANPSAMTSVQLPDEKGRVMIETWTDHSFTPPPPDTRELALMVRWSFR